MKISILCNHSLKHPVSAGDKDIASLWRVSWNPLNRKMSPYLLGLLSKITQQNTMYEKQSIYLNSQKKINYSNRIWIVKAWCLALPKFSLLREKQSLNHTNQVNSLMARWGKKLRRHIKYLTSFIPTVINLAKIWSKCFLLLNHSLICA